MFTNQATDLLIQTLGLGNTKYAIALLEKALTDAFTMGQQSVPPSATAATSGSSSGSSGAALNLSAVLQ